MQLLSMGNINAYSYIKIMTLQTCASINQSFYQSCLATSRL